jgi:hypothetical protein
MPVSVCPVCGWKEVNPISLINHVMNPYIEEKSGQEVVFNSEKEKLSTTDKMGNDHVWIRKDVYLSSVQKAQSAKPVVPEGKK